MLEKIKETAAFLKQKMNTQPKTAIILGTGLGRLADEITDSYSIPYKDIPNFPISTVEGHSGKLIFGKLGGKDIMAMQGRFHFYEGYSMKQVTFPIRRNKPSFQSGRLDDYHRPYQFLPGAPTSRTEYWRRPTIPGYE